MFAVFAVANINRQAAGGAGCRLRAPKLHIMTKRRNHCAFKSSSLGFVGINGKSFAARITDFMRDNAVFSAGRFGTINCFATDKIVTRRGNHFSFVNLNAAAFAHDSAGHAVLYRRTHRSHLVYPD